MNRGRGGTITVMYLGRLTFAGRVVFVLFLAAILVAGTKGGVHAIEAVESHTIDLRPVDGRLVSEEVIGSFDLLSLQWSGEDQLQLRIRRGAIWSPWETITFDSHGGDIAPSAVDLDAEHVSDLMWVGDGDGFQVRSDSAGTVVVETRKVSDGPSPVLQVTKGEALAATSEVPTIISRSTWDPTDACHPRVEPTRIQPTHLIVHHTSASASANSYTAEEVPDMILGYCLYHRDGRLWDDLAYNFVIDRFGRTWEGRFGGIDQGIRGGSSMGANYTSVGVALIGNHEIGDPSPAARAALVELLAWLSDVHNLDADGVEVFVSEGSHSMDPGDQITLPVISGHRDTQATACPGYRAYQYLSEIRAQTASASGPYAPYDDYEEAVAGDFNGDSLTDAAAFNSSTGNWWVSTNIAGSAVTSSWADFATASGWSSQVAGDFTGDGLDDIANFHPGNGTWWVSRSTGSGFSTRLWADFSTASGWEARLVGDFTGDGLDDIAQFHPGNGTWWVSESTGSGFATRLRATAPIIGSHVWLSVQDATGDGIDDLLVLDRVEGRWDIVGLHAAYDVGYTTFRSGLLVPFGDAPAAFDTRRRTWLVIDAAGSVVFTRDSAQLD